MFASIKRLASRLVRQGLSRLGYQLVRSIPPLTVEQFILQKFGRESHVTFIQVGAHDGTHNDPISSFRELPGWSGLLLEPNPKVWERLKLTLASNPRSKPLNVALSATCEQLPFYRVSDPSACLAPFWADQVSSFDRDHVVKMLRHFGHADNEAEALVEQIAVETRTFDQLLDTLGDQKLNLLFIDAEGADWRLLSSFPFDRAKPEMIVFEYVHLPKVEHDQIMGVMTQYGYSFVAVGEDIVAVNWNQLQIASLR